MRNLSRTKFYIIGFITSILLTLVAYFPVYQHVKSNHQTISHEFITYFVLILAVLQFLTQLIFFLHIGKEQKPRWNLISLISFIGIILIIVLGTLIIMHNLNYNMSASDMSNYMIKEEGIKK